VSPRSRSSWPLLALLALLAAPAPVPAQRRGEVPLTDVLQIVVLEREVLAIDAESGGTRSRDLEIGEQVRWTGSRGRVGVVLTDRRVLAVATRSAAWQEARWRRTERPPDRALLGDRVAVLASSVRAIGFDGGSGNLVERTLAPSESVLRSEVSENVGVVVTARRAMGVTPFVGGFFEVDLHVSERLEGVEATGNLATVRTSHRLLTFSALSGAWAERNLDLR
jgi:hypothetical protein